MDLADIYNNNDRWALTNIPTNNFTMFASNDNLAIKNTDGASHRLINFSLFSVGIAVIDRTF